MKLRAARWWLWALLTLAVATLALYPVSTLSLRSALVVVTALWWFGLVALCWRAPVPRVVALGISAAVAIFVMLPGSRAYDRSALRVAYTQALQRYNGVPYYWGGETPVGIDCSGLVRRALIDACLSRGVLTANPLLVRRALDVWWHDTTAKALGEEYLALTRVVATAPNLRDLDHASVLPGDLAVTRNGLHVLAYEGDRQWIQADPSAQKVISVSASSENEWLAKPMTIVRWQLLSEG